jgi:hypothetical protein
MLDHIIFQFVLIFAGAALFATLFLYLRQPIILAYIVLGIFVGPKGLGLIEDAELVEQLAHIGIILLLFLIGLNFQPKKLGGLLGRIGSTVTRLPLDRQFNNRRGVNVLQHHCQHEVDTHHPVASSSHWRGYDKRAVAAGRNSYYAYRAGNRGRHGRYFRICCLAIAQAVGARCPVIRFRQIRHPETASEIRCNKRTYLCYGLGLGPVCCRRRETARIVS